MPGLGNNNVNVSSEAQGETPSRPKPALNDPAATFRWLLTKHGWARRNHPLGAQEDYPFLREEEYHLRELRLFARVYPKVAEEQALAIATNQNADEMDRAAAIHTLQVLASQGIIACEKALFDIASSKDDNMRNVALDRK